MTVSFSGSELVEIAVQMEKNGLSFYASAADRLSSPKAKDLFHKLANDEAHHLAFFQKMLTSTALAELQETYPGEYMTYMKAHVDGQIFTEARMNALLVGKSLAERDALQFGMDAEKDSILYYTEMLRFVPFCDHALVERIIDEEKKHLAGLVASAIRL